MRRDPAFLFFPGEALVDMTGFDRVQRGAYLDLVMAQFSKGHLMPDLCRGILWDDYDHCWPAISGIMEKDEEGRYFIGWVDREIKKRQEFNKKQSENSKKRWQSHGITTGMPDGSRGTDLGHLKGIPSISNLKIKDQEITGGLESPIGDSNPPRREKAGNMKELMNASWVLRCHEDEFKMFVGRVAMLINEENRARPTNPFRWQSQMGLEGDLKLLIYKTTDETKIKILTDAYGMLKEKKNWVDYVYLAVLYTIRASLKTKITNPLAFTKAVINDPFKLISERADGSLASLAPGGER